MNKFHDKNIKLLNQINVNHDYYVYTADKTRTCNLKSKYINQYFYVYTADRAAIRHVIWSNRGRKHYNEFFDHFKNVFRYSISDSLTIVESDQGKALKKAANDQDMFHICCLRHLLVSLGRNIYSYQVGNLVKSTSNNEYQELKRLYEERWSSITEPTEKTKLTKMLKKLAMFFQMERFRFLIVQDG